MNPVVELVTITPSAVVPVPEAVKVVSTPVEEEVNVIPLPVPALVISRTAPVQETPVPQFWARERMFDVSEISPAVSVPDEAILSMSPETVVVVAAAFWVTDLVKTAWEPETVVVAVKVEVSSISRIRPVVKASADRSTPVPVVIELALYVSPVVVVPVKDWVQVEVV